jgi:ferritin-like metal-binding protein YciE
MSAKTPKEAFVMLLSHVRQGTEKEGAIFNELGKLAEDPQIKEALEARALVSHDVLGRIDECFKMLNEKPVQLSGRLQEIFVEDFHKAMNEIQAPAARRLFVLAKLIHLTHLRIGEYVALVAAADVTEHWGVGVLLESCLADKLAFVERTRRLIRAIVEHRLAERKELAHA